VHGQSSALFHIAFEITQARTPERLIVAQPVVDGTERLGIELTNARGSVPVGDDQAGAAQQAKVLRDRRAAGSKIPGELAARMSTAVQQAEDLPPSRIGDRTKYALLLSRLGNHLDTVTTRLRSVNGNHP